MTWTPDLAGVIERRVLVNYRVDPGIAARLLPAPFRPQLVQGHAVAGICLIRLGAMRPAGLPAAVGFRSENAAHRIAVEWDGPSGPQTGVYIPRRDTDSVVNVAVGGRLFPGAHHRADFRVEETDAALRVGFRARDASAAVDVAVHLDDALRGSRLFTDTAAASAFFEQGFRGFSATRDADRCDGLSLHTSAWHIDAATVDHVSSSFFDDVVAFPPGSCELDCALVMRRVPVTWRALAPLQVTQVLQNS